MASNIDRLTKETMNLEKTITRIEKFSDRPGMSARIEDLRDRIQNNRQEIKRILVQDQLDEEFGFASHRGVHKK